MKQEKNHVRIITTLLVFALLATSLMSALAESTAQTFTLTFVFDERNSSTIDTINETLSGLRLSNVHFSDENGYMITHTTGNAEGIVKVEYGYGYDDITLTCEKGNEPLHSWQIGVEVYKAEDYTDSDSFITNWENNNSGARITSLIAYKYTDFYVIVFLYYTENDELDESGTEEKPVVGDAITALRTSKSEYCPICSGRGTCHHCVNGNCVACLGRGTVDCSDCQGIGICQVCIGSGLVSKYVDGKGIVETKCPSCNGIGICPTCNGSQMLKCSFCGGTGTCIYCMGSAVCWYCNGTGRNSRSDADHSGEEPVSFADAEFGRMTRAAMGKGEDEPIYPSELEGIRDTSIRTGNMLFSTEIQSYVSYDQPGTLDLTDLKLFPNLYFLDITDMECTGFEILAELPELRRLTLIRVGLTDCGFLSGMHLIGLDLAGNNIADFIPITCVEGLKELNVFNTGLNSLEFVRGMNLTMLVAGNNPIFNLEPISGMTELTSLSIQNTDVASLDALRNLAQLESLNISDLEGDISLEPLYGLGKLRQIYCFGVMINDLDNEKLGQIM